MSSTNDPELEIKFQPFKMKIVENIRISTRAERLKWVEEADYNLFNLNSNQIMLDLLTDSGCNALSDNQASKLITGDETYAGASSFFNFKKAVQELTGYKHVYPTHQGRGAERILFTAVCGDNTIIPNNSHFDTTRLNIELTKATAVDLICNEANDFNIELPFKGTFFDF